MNPSASERLLTAVADLQHYIRHGVDEKTCGACPRWDELQDAALGMVGERDGLLAENERLLSALIGMVGGGDLSELREMENALRSLALQENDKAAMVGALRVLIEALEGREK